MRRSRPRRWIGLFLLAFVACRAPFHLGGIQVREPDTERWIEALVEEGFNTVSLTVYARQGEWDSAQLSSEAEASWLLPEIRAARAAGLAVVLILRLELDHAFTSNRFLWHGLVHPKGDEDVAAWFDRYTEFARKWAEIAEEEGVHVLGIGSEMNALAATLPVDALPPLEAYYLNPESQQSYQENVLRHEARIDPEELRGGAWDETFESVQGYLSEESEAHRAWAEQVTFGADLEAMNRRRALLLRHWTELIATLRRTFSGRLTYAANFDQYQSVGFWQHLDLMGINAYFPLRQGSSPSQRQLDASRDPAALAAVFRQAWSDVFAGILDFQKTAGLAPMPVIFTELGYTARTGATLKPWAGDGFNLVGPWQDPDLVVWRQQAHAPQERALAVQALHEASRETAPDLLQGLLYWKLSTQAEHRKIEPFVLILGEESEDPLLPALRRFVE